MNQLLLKKMLEEMGMNVDVASNGREAVDLSLKNRYDIVLMDFFMPEMNGIEATEEIRKSSLPNSMTPIVALSATSDWDSRDRTKSVGMNAFIQKPVTMAQLRLAIEAQLAPGRKSSASITY